MPTTLYREAHVTTAAEGKFTQDVTLGSHHLLADETKEDGGDDRGPAPHEFLLIGLGACTSMTVKMYADRKGWPLRSVDVKCRGRRDDTEGFSIERDLVLVGELDDEQRARLTQIAEKCPVHRSLSRATKITTRVL